MFATEHLSYDQTAAFSKIVLHYLSGENSLKPFYKFSPDLEGIQAAIEQKAAHTIDRETLVAVLKEQYKSNSNKQVLENIESLLSPRTFTVCTAHQPNLFSGPLYFIYKILHAIKLAEHLNQQFPEHHFVPVFYMGSEDADLEELNHFTISGKKYRWNTRQKGAVGRMAIDDEIETLIDELQGQLGVEPFGKAFSHLLRDCYRKGTTIQEATFRFVNTLFSDYGLLVLIADDARLKKQLVSIFEEDLFRHQPSKIVESTCQKLAEHYKVQASPRAINLFYLTEGSRERLERDGEDFCVVNTELRFSKDQIREELKNHPERFSPNVILRGLYQESILPNIAFIGGGGELAYWLQLQELFQHYNVPFPVLILRNSLQIVPAKDKELLDKLSLPVHLLFQPRLQVLNALLKEEGKMNQLHEEETQLAEWFSRVSNKATVSDPSLEKHVAALKAQSLRRLQALRQKMLRAERRKMAATERQIERLQTSLSLNGSLQERVENIGAYYAKWGPEFIRTLYNEMLPLDAKFVVLYENSDTPAQLK